MERKGSPGLPEGLVLGLGAQVCDVLAYLHSQKPPVIFRDLKPANIMLTANGEIRLVDFGIAHSFSAVRGNSLVGTPGYAPVEQYQGLSDERSDLFSLGATLHHLLTGCDPRDQPPFAFKPVRLLVPAISKATESVVLGLLRKDPAERGPNVDELGRQLRRIEGGPLTRHGTCRDRRDVGTRPRRRNAADHHVAARRDIGSRYSAR